MNETYVTIVGNVVDDPIRRMTRANDPFVTFRLASTVRRPAPNGGGYVDGGTNYVNVSAFRSLAVHIDASIKRGHPVIVSGRLRVNNWVSGDKSGTSVEIDANHVGHNLALGTATFEKSRGPVTFDDADRLSDPAVQAAREALESAAYPGSGVSGTGDGDDGRDGEDLEDYTGAEAQYAYTRPDLAMASAAS